MLETEPSQEAEFAARRAEARGVRFTRLWFVDVLGTPKAVAIPASELRTVLERGVGVDGSILDGTVRGRERDVIAVPDPSTFQVLPWVPDERVARMFCEIALPDGTPASGDSRRALRNVLAQARDLGYDPQVGAEVEFFLFDADGELLDDGGYFDFEAQDRGAGVRRDAIEHLEFMGIPVKASHHEAAPSQHEIDLVHTDPLAMADALVTMRAVVREVAATHGLLATFMPKPITGAAGSGLHLHLSLFCDGENAFFDEDADRLLSPTGAAFLGGLLAHAPEYLSVTNQWPNSYKRLAPGFEAPQTAGWSEQGQASLVRVPAKRPDHPEDSRMELRVADPACNPYLALACVVGAGLAGLERTYQPPASDAELGQAPRQALPRSLGEALTALEASELMRDTLGDHIVETIIRNKVAELDAERATVTREERDALLRRL